MAKKKAGTAAEAEAKAKGSSKRSMARAKVKTTAETGGKANGGKPMSEAARSKRRKETLRNVIIAIFAVLMALSMMLPSLSTIFSNNNQYQEAEAEAEAASDAEESDSDSDSESGNTAVAKVDENYTTTITPLEEKLKDDPNDLATLLNLGNDYMQWAYAVSTNSEEGDDETEHMNDLFEKAIDYYDQYLKKNDSVAVRVNRALCQFYSGDTTGAIDALKALTESQPDYGPAWANLGLLYESSFQFDEAKETYKKAAEVDADDEYGAKSFANQRLASLNSSEVSRPADTLTSTSPSDVTGLSDVLNDASGTSISGS